MAPSRVLLSVAGLVLCLCTVNAFLGPNPGSTPLGTDSTGIYDAGYVYISDVQSYINMTLDYCDIVAAVTAGDNETALDIYLYGKNAEKGAVYRTFREWAVANHTGEYFYDLLAEYNDMDTLDAGTRAAISASDLPAVQHFLHIMRVKYAYHEYDAAVFNTGLNNTAPDSGAPHNLDEALAMFLGTGFSCPGATQYAVMQANAQMMGTAVSGMAPGAIAVPRHGMAALIGSAAFNDTDAVETAYHAIREETLVAKLQTLMLHAYAKTAMAWTDCADGSAHMSELIGILRWLVNPMLHGFLVDQGMSTNATMTRMEAFDADMAEAMSYHGVETAVMRVVDDTTITGCRLGAPTEAAREDALAWQANYCTEGVAM
ncbi:hypothetical protein FOA52_004326 [Chlamydomonas sp. UWO 241]|nr:hypothetical protein FOA52_004326 [Chlamydomonas sp. UWO 241]